MARLPKTSVPTAAMNDPLGFCYTLLTKDGDTSSLEIARQTGIPGSTLRSIRNEVHDGISFDVWHRLLLYYEVIR